MKLQSARSEGVIGVHLIGSNDQKKIYAITVISGLIMLVWITRRLCANVICGWSEHCQKVFLDEG